MTPSPVPEGPRQTLLDAGRPNQIQIQIMRVKIKYTRRHTIIISAFIYKNNKSVMETELRVPSLPVCCGVLLVTL